MYAEQGAPSDSTSKPSRRLVPTTLAALAIVTSVGGLPGGTPRVGAAQSAADAPTTFDVSTTLVTSLTKVLQTTGLSAPVTIPAYPLPDGRTAKASVRALPLWHDNAEIAIPSGKQWVGSGRPRHLTQLLGRVTDQHATTVQLRLTDQGLTGFVLFDGRLHRQTFEGNRVTFQPMGSATGDPALDSVCALDQPPGKPLIGTPPTPTGPPGESLADYLATLGPARPPRVTDALAAFCCVGVPGSQALKFFDVAIETDDELMIRFNYSSLAVQRHVTDLIAAVNALYWDANTGVIFRLRWFHIYQAGHEGRTFDIFEDQDYMERGNSFLRVAALRDLWNTDPDRVAKTQINRDMALLISGTHLGGSNIFQPWECVVGGQSNGQSCSLPGQACGNGGTCRWVGETLCRKDKAYAAISYLDYVVDPFATQVNTTAHELAHLFGAEHAHCTDTMTPASAPPVDPIDRCRNTGSSMRGDACWRGPTQPPPNNTDTVMSICGSQFANVQRGLVFHERSAQIVHDAAMNGTCGKPATVVVMQNGQPIQNLQSTTMAVRHYFAIDVPPGQTELEIETQGTGELLLYARYGTLPTTWGTSVSNLPGTANQRILVPNPRAGRFYILIFGWNPFSNVELRAEFS